MFVEPLYHLGELVRDIEAPNSIFEIHGVNTRVTNDKEHDALDVEISYSIIDIKINTHMVKKIKEERLLLTDDEDAKLYYSNKKLKPLVEIQDYTMQLITLANGLSRELIDTHEISEEDEDDVEEVVVEKTINNLLDEYNDYKLMITMFGDEDGYYKEKLHEIVREFMTIENSK